MTTCNWTPSCSNRAVRKMHCQTRPGLVVAVDVCDGHVAAADLWGYRTAGSPLDVSKYSAAETGLGSANEGYKP